jgi:anti-anti-sigma regulatory factor
VASDMEAGRSLAWTGPAEPACGKMGWVHHPPMKLTSGHLQVELVARDGEQELRLVGRIDEKAELPHLQQQIPDSRLAIDLSGVEFINSIGVREWCIFLRKLLRRGHEVVLRRCSETMVHQMNMILDVWQGTIIESIFLPYHCPKCLHEESVCINVEVHRADLQARRAPAHRCPRCQTAMALNELPERYLLFLSAS